MTASRNGNEPPHATASRNQKRLMDPVVESNEPLQRFQICGSEGRWIWANAEITGRNTVTVWHSDIKQPTEVRYAWSVNADHANLYNKAREDANGVFFSVQRLKREMKGFI